MKIDRSLKNLNKDFKYKVELFLGELGDRIFITESYRSLKRQKYLYSLGRIRPGKKVTWTLESNHRKGLAIDIAFMGGDLYPKDIKEWKEVAKIAKKYGIVWGYDLRGTDKPHFQDNGKPLQKDIFLKNSKYGKFIKKRINEGFKFNDYLDDRPATIADVKELITLYSQRK